jgi:hypothetical protein
VKLRRSLHAKRWTLLAAAGFVALTALFGSASSAGAREAGPTDDPDVTEQIEARFCGASSPYNPVGWASWIANKTSFCEGASEAAGKVYCNNTSLLAMLDPNTGFGDLEDGNLDGDQAIGGGQIDKSQTALNAITPGMMKIWIDQLNGKWYDLRREDYPEGSSVGWYYDTAKTQAIEKGNCSLLENPPSYTCEEMRTGVAGGKPIPDRVRETRSRDGILPDDCVGTYPSANYNVSYDGGWFTSVDRKIWGGATGFVFNIGKGAIQVATWAIDAAYRLDLTDYTPMAQEISDRYQAKIIGPWGLDDFAWLILVGYVGISALRGKIGMAGGELFAAAIFIGMANLLLANQSMYMNEVSRTINLASGALFQVATKPVSEEDRSAVADTPTADGVAVEALQPFRTQLHVMFVEQPYEYINWGQPIETMPQECRDRANQVTQVGITGDNGWSWQHMSDAGDKCTAMVSYNRAPTATRFFGALLTMIVGLVVGVTITLMAITVMVAKFTVAILFAILPYAVAMAPLPGPARRAPLVWLTSTGQAGAVVIGTANGLAMAVIAFAFIGDQNEALVLRLNGNEAERISLMELWAPTIVAALAMWVGRKRMIAATQRISEKFADNLTRLSPAASNWGGGGGGGVDFLAADRGVNRTAQGASTAAWRGAMLAAVPLSVAAATTGQRYRERRQAKRALRNLEIMKQRDEQPKLTRNVTYEDDGHGRKRARETLGWTQTIRAPRVTDAPGESRTHMRMAFKPDLDRAQRQQAFAFARRWGFRGDDMTGEAGSRLGTRRAPRPVPSRVRNARPPASSVSGAWWFRFRVAAVPSAGAAARRSAHSITCFS